MTSIRCIERTQSNMQPALGSLVVLQVLISRFKAVVSGLTPGDFAVRGVSNACDGPVLMNVPVMKMPTKLIGGENRAARDR